MKKQTKKTKKPNLLIEGKFKVMSANGTARVTVQRAALKKYIKKKVFVRIFEVKK